MERSGNQRDLVVKIKYGGALRRFAAHVNGNRLDYDMGTLRTKIIHLFELSEDADLVLTYTDVDGDVVTLSTDDELFDAAIFQSLNPLRINVHMNNNTSTNNPSNDSTTTIPSRTLPGLEFLPPQVNTIVQESLRSIPQVNTIVQESLRSIPQVNTIVQESLRSIPQVNTIVQESLRSIPDPVRGTLTKISEEVSKVAATSPALTELVDFLSKLGQSHFGPLHVDTPGSASEPQSVAGNNCSSTVAPGDLLSELHVPPMCNLFDLTLDKEQIRTGNEVETQKNDAQDKGKSVTASASFIGFTCDAEQNVGLPSTRKTNFHGLDLNGSSRNEFKDNVAASNFCSDSDNGFITTHPSASSGGRSGGLHCPAGFSRRESFGLHDGLAQAFHRGVSCDGCGMLPITGPRYKSKVQENYDLCNICFSELGNERDYIQIDRPVYRPPRSFKGFFGPHSAHHAFRGWGMRPAREKLESRFIQDITILDGTFVAPSTEFTKIWRMRNSGSISWPRGTRLVRVGGDVLADKSAVQLDIPFSGFPPNEEIDIAVDFRAPSMPGRYISYWRLASPLGQKFGQRVWVLIHVENYGPNWQTAGVPPQCNWDAAGEANFESVVEVQHANSDQSGIDAEQAKPSSSGSPHRSTVLAELAFQGAQDAASKPVMPDMDLSALYHASSNVPSNTAGNPLPFIPYPVISMPMQSSAPPEFDSLVSYPVIDPPLERSGSPLVSTSTPLGCQLDDATEKALLRELEEIGFKEMDLNKEILRKNEYDLEQSVDDLCSIADWHPLLEELQEMGFYDKEKNIKLLAKNGGSLKRAVLDLISGGSE